MSTLILSFESYPGSLLEICLDHLVNWYFQWGLWSYLKNHFSQLHLATRLGFRSNFGIRWRMFGYCQWSVWTRTCCNQNRKAGLQTQTHQWIVDPTIAILSDQFSSRSSCEVSPKMRTLLIRPDPFLLLEENSFPLSPTFLQSDSKTTADSDCQRGWLHQHSEAMPPLVDPSSPWCLLPTF